MSEPSAERARDVAGAALRLPPERRAEHLRAACGDDADLLRRAQGLLAEGGRTADLGAGERVPRADVAGACAGGPTEAVSASGTPGAGGGGPPDPWGPAFAAEGSRPPDASADAGPGARGGRRPDASGSRIGPYRLLQPIGEGGFGTVYMAEQEHPVRRRVAVKVIKLGMDTRQVIARFDAERQALALMDHPNIAKVLDAGATDAGRPYFVMELVHGAPITEYCDRHRLALDQRLELFASVCDAVQHAHGKGVIHRDLKPSNILVTTPEKGPPRPVVIDFGIAKAVSQRLTEKTIFTEQGQLIGTPEYMSPEQAEMGDADIDTRTDVYALGVVLYVLLTGALPFDPGTLRSAGYAAIQKMIREAEPPRPSTRLSALGEAASTAAQARQLRLDELTRTLRSELEWIPLRAMRKDRTERYRTAAELADDVRNYLAHRPLIAGPESVSYQLRKLLRRNRGPAAAAAAILLTLLLGLTGTIWKAREARREANAARAAEAAQSAARQDADRRTAEATQARDAAEFEAYLANLIAADASHVANEPAGVRARLDACAERLRGWEWRWRDARSDESILFFREGRPFPWTSTTFSPGGNRVLTASTDEVARLWDAVTGRQLVALPHPRMFNSGTFSADGKRVATRDFDGHVRVWDADTGRQLLAVERVLHGTPALSRDGTRMLVCQDLDTALVWDVSAGAELCSIRGHEVLAAAFNPDGTRVLTSSADKFARVCDATTGRELLRLGEPLPLGTLPALSPTGTRIATVSGAGVARVWDADSGKELLALRGHEGGIRSVAFSPDGSRVVTASDDGTGRVWDATTGRALAILRGHQGEVMSIAMSPDGARVVTVSFDKTVRLWDSVTGQELLILRGHDHELGIQFAGFSSDGTRLLTKSFDGVRVWDAGARMEAVLQRSGEVRSALWNPDGSRILIVGQDGRARVADSLTGKELAVLDGHDGEIKSAAFSQDGTRIVTASVDKTARVWDAASGKPLVVLRGHDDSVSSATFSPDNSRILSVSGAVHVWDFATGREVATLRVREGRFKTAAFSSDGTRIVAATTDKNARVWDAATGKELVLLPKVWEAEFSRDGGRIVGRCVDDAARVWDAGTGKELAVLPRNNSALMCARFSPDGRWILTASDKLAKVWDVHGKELAVLRGHQTLVRRAVFSMNGERIITTSADGTARVWHTATGKELAVLRGGIDSAVFSADGVQVMTVSRFVRVWDSVPYRDRYPAIARARAAEAKMVPIVRAMVDAGRAPDEAARSLAADASLTSEERVAAQAELHAIRERGR